MKILIIPSWYKTESSPNSGVFFLEQAKALKDAGNDVKIAYPELISLKSFTSNKFNIRSTCDMRDDIETYRKKIYNYKIFNPLEKRKLYLHGLKKLISNIITEDWRPDVIHAHSVFWGGWAATYISKTYNIPLVLTEHSSAFLRDEFSKEDVAIIEYTLKNTTSIISVGPSLKEKLQKFTNKKIFLIPNMVNGDFLENPNSARDKATKKQTCFRIFSLGTLKKEKGMKILIESFYKSQKKYSNMQLFIGGDGPQRTELEKYIRSFDLEKKVFLLGELNRENVKEEMIKSNLFALASYKETFGVVYTEALAVGKPIIATKCGGPEIIVNQQNGILCNVGDVEEISKAIIYIQENINDYSAKKIIRDCLNRFGEKKIINELLVVYKKTRSLHRYND